MVQDDNEDNKDGHNLSVFNKVIRKNEEVNINRNLEKFNFHKSIYI